MDTNGPANGHEQKLTADGRGCTLIKTTEATIENLSASICVNLRLDLSFAFASIRLHSCSFVVVYNAPAFRKTRICAQATKQISGNINIACATPYPGCKRVNADTYIF